MAGKAILDTSFVVRVINGNAPARSRLAILDQTFLPVVVVGELIFGAVKSSRAAQNLARIDDFIAQSIIVSVDLETAGIYGRLKNERSIVGRPIPENDLWIAALAIQYDLVLVTSDRHFEAIEGLMIDLFM